MQMDNKITMPKRFDYSFNKEFNAEIDRVIAQPTSNKILLDCADMEYLDSVGIGLLVMVYKRTKDAEKPIEMIRLNPSVRDILQLANMQKIINFA